MTYLLVPEPKQLESINGYIQRLANENYYDSIWIYKVLRIPPYTNKKHIGLINLAKLINITESDVYKLTYHHLFSETQQQGLSTNIRYYISDHSKYCPKCFVQNPFHNKLWDLSFNLFCHEHGCLLIDVCPSCNSPINSNLKNMLLCNCGFQLKDLPVIDFKEHIHIGQTIYDVFTDQSCSTSHPLRKLSPKELSDVVMFFTQRIYFDKFKSNPRFGTVTYNNENFRKIIMEVFEIFSDWPINFHSFLTEFGKVAKRTDRVTGISTYFGKFYVQFYRELNGSSYDFIRTEFEAFIKENWTNGSFKRIEIFKVKLGETKYISLPEACNILKVNPPIILKLVNSGRINGINNAVGIFNQVNIEYQSLMEYKNNQENYVSSQTAAEILGVTRQAIIHLFNNEIIGGYFDVYDNKKIKSYNIEKSSIYELLDSFEKLVQTNEDVQDNYNFKRTIKSVGCKGIRIDKFIKSVINGNLPITGKTNGVGLNQFLFSESLLDAHILKMSELDGSLCLKQVCNYLKVDYKTCKLWIEEGFITISRVESKIIFIDKVNLDDFLHKYVYLGELIRLTRKNSKTLLSEIKGKNINFVASPKKRGGSFIGGYLFRRADINEFLESNYNLRINRAINSEGNLGIDSYN